MDVKFCFEHPGRNVSLWKRRGLEVVVLSDVVEPVTPTDEDTIVTKHSTETVTSLIVTYDGFARRGDDLLASDTKYAELFRVHAGDIVVSNISAHYGAVAVVPDDLDGCVVTKEVTILRTKPSYDPRVIWVLLRSPEIRADLLLSAAGANRTRVDWAGMQTIQLPRPTLDTATKIVSEIVEAERLEREAAEKRRAILLEVETELVFRL